MLVEYIGVSSLYERKKRFDGFLTKKLGIFVLLYVHIVDYSTTLEVF